MDVGFHIKDSTGILEFCGTPRSKTTMSCTGLALNLSRRIINRDKAVNPSAYMDNINFLFPEKGRKEAISWLTIMYFSILMVRQ